MVKAILKELELRKKEFKGDTIESVYFGGGTPSILKAEAIDEIVKAINEHYNVNKHAEISLEVNPDDLAVEKLEAWKHSGVNRLSVGIQSFFEEDLKWMNRAHTAGEAIEGIALVKRFFENFTIDLIYGIPGMDHERWAKNIAIAMSYEVPHISSYALTIEPRTVFGNHQAKGKLQEMDESDMLMQFQMLIDETEKQGLMHYEISNFGKPDYFSKHNLSYWEGKSYLGVGPSAHSFNGTERSWNVSSNSKYVKALMNNDLPMTIEQLNANDRYNEFVMTGLRTCWGISLEEVTVKFGKQARTYLEQQAQIHLNSGVLELRQNQDGTNQLLITRKGKFLADGIASDLFIV